MKMNNLSRKKLLKYIDEKFEEYWERSTHQYKVVVLTKEITEKGVIPIDNSNRGTDGTTSTQDNRLYGGGR